MLQIGFLTMRGQNLTQFARFTVELFNATNGSVSKANKVDELDSKGLKKGDLSPCLNQGLNEGNRPSRLNEVTFGDVNLHGLQKDRSVL